MEDKTFPRSNVTIALTADAFRAYSHFRLIDFAAKRYPVAIGRSGVVFYDPREYNSHSQNDLC